MKFVCDNCSTQYLISDDKVGAKGVKVRCKRCGDVILVRPLGLEDHRATDPAGRAVRFSQADAPFETQDGVERDDVGMAFDQLLQGGLGSDEEDRNGSGEELATEIFRMDDIKRQRGRAGDDDHDKIDQVFAGAESTELRPRAGSDRRRSDWYVAVGDEQVGPMGQAELETRWAKGEIDAGTLTWFPGMSDWRPAGEIPELRHLVQARQAGMREATDVQAPEGVSQPEPASPGGQAGQGDWAPYKGSELTSLVEEEMAVVSQPPPDEESPLADDGSADGILPSDDSEVPPWEMEEPVSGRVAKPADNFFDSSLDKSPGGEQDEYFNSTYSRSGRVLAGPAYLGGAKKSAPKGKWIAIGILAGVILAGGTVAAIVIGGGQEPPPKVEPLTPPKPPEAATGDPKADPATGPDAGTKGPEPVNPDGPPDQPVSDPPKEQPGTSAGEKDKPAGDGVVVARPPSAAKPGDRGDSGSRLDRGRKKRKTTTADSRGPDKPPATQPGKPVKPAADPASDLPQKLSKSQISETMKKYIQAMKSCVEQQRQRDPTVTGTMNVSFTIEPSGKVTIVMVKTEEHKGTYVAGCIAFIIKSMKFPPARESFTVPVLPLKLGG